jgi:hypothetical protein
MQWKIIDAGLFARNRSCGLKMRCLGSRWAMRIENGRDMLEIGLIVSILENRLVTSKMGQNG